MTKESTLAFIAAISTAALLSACGGSQGGSREEVRAVGPSTVFPFARSAHVDAIKGLREYVAEWTKSWSKGGLLAKQGMVVAPAAVLATSAATAAGMTPLDPNVLK
jgi:hypothetical protein